MPMTTAEADKIHSVGFAPWVREPGPRMEAVRANRVPPRPAWLDRPLREGGGPSGQG